MKHPEITAVNTELEDDLKKYLAIPPYNTFTNPVAYDGHYLNSLYNKYGEDIVKKELASLSKFLQKLSQNLLTKSLSCVILYLQEVRGLIRWFPFPGWFSSHPSLKTFEKFQRNFQKPLDKSKTLWYNKGTNREGRDFSGFQSCLSEKSGSYSELTTLSAGSYSFPIRIAV